MLQILAVLRVGEAVLEVILSNRLILLAVVGSIAFLLWTGQLGELLAAGWDWLAAFGAGLWNWFVDQLAADLNPFAGAPALG